MNSAFGKYASRAAFAAFAMSFAGTCLAGEYDGHWRLWDSKGAPFEVDLHADGKADGTHNDAMKHGTWAEEGGAAVIHWNTGWTTRIARQGQGYEKTAFKPGAAMTDKPTNHSAAVKAVAPAPGAGK